MIDIKQVEKNIKNDLKNINNNDVINIKCFKKDRILMIKKQNKQFYIFENGFNKNEFIFNQEDLKELIKKIKKLIKYEFHNSNKLWYSISISK